MFYSLPLTKVWQQVGMRGLQFFYIIFCVQILENGKWAWGNCIKMLQEKRSWTGGVGKERNIDGKSLIFNQFFPLPPFVLTCRYPWFAEGISECCVELLWALLSVPLDGALCSRHMPWQPFPVYVCMRETVLKCWSLCVWACLCSFLCLKENHLINIIQNLQPLKWTVVEALLSQCYFLPLTQ